MDEVAKKIYRADAVKFSKIADDKAQKISELSFSHLPICIAKTEVEKRKEFGHFEMDLIQNGKDFILTIIERKTRFLIMERLTRGKNAEEVV